MAGKFVEGNQAWKKREDRRVLTNALQRAVIQFESEEHGVKAGQAAARIAENIVKAAVGNDRWAIQFTFERLDGKPDAKVDITHHEGESIGEKQAREMAEEFLAYAARTESVGEA